MLDSKLLEYGPPRDFLFFFSLPHFQVMLDNRCRIGIFLRKKDGVLEVLMNLVRVFFVLVLSSALLIGCGEGEQQEPEQKPVNAEQRINPNDIPDQHLGMRSPADINSQPVDELPVALTPMRAPYPDTAKALGLEGTVILNLLIDTTGSVRLVEFEQHAEEPAPILDKSAVLTAKKSKWKPATKDGQPVQAWVRVPFEFKLKEDKAE
jgi:protein TonB